MASVVALFMIRMRHAAAAIGNGPGEPSW
jgi:hypothetical protein